MVEIFEKAWGNYIALFEFLTDSDVEKGLIQIYNFASLLPYDLGAENYNNFLLLNSINYVAPGSPEHDTTGHLDPSSKLEHSSSLVSSYSSFLDRLDSLIAETLDPATLPDLKLLEEKVAKAQGELENYQTSVHDKWVDWVAANLSVAKDELPAKRIIWEREYSYSATTDRKRRNVQIANARLNAWLRTKVSSELQLLLKARTYFDDSGYMFELPIAAQHDKPQKKHYWRRFHMQLPIFDLQEFLDNDSRVDSSFDTKDEYYKRVETNWNVKLKARWGWFSGSASAEKRELETLSRKTEFSFKVSFERFQEVEIYRDDWFQPLLFDTVGKDFDEFWGRAGILATYPVSLFICRGMNIAVNISKEYKNALEKFFKAGGSVGFGPFYSGGASYEKDENYMDYEFTREGFTLTDGKRTVRILGARVHRPNWSQQKANNYYEELDRPELIKIAEQISTTRK